MGLRSLDGAVGLVTGGAGGIGSAVARALAAAGGKVVVADVDEAAGKEVADSVGGVFVATDVTDPAASERAVATAERTYGRLDFAHLNAGISITKVLDDLDVAIYRRIVGINLDGVVFGAMAAVPALRRAGGGALVATASLAGLVGTPTDPLYALTKHGVVGFVRSLGPELAQYGISANAVCPGFTDTAILGENVHRFRDADFPLLTADEVAATVMKIALSDGTGECWPVQPGRESEPFRFRRVPGPRVPGHEGQLPPGGVS